MCCRACAPGDFCGGTARDLEKCLGAPRRCERSAAVSETSRSTQPYFQSRFMGSLFSVFSAFIVTWNRFGHSTFKTIGALFSFSQREKAGMRSPRKKIAHCSPEPDRERRGSRCAQRGRISLWRVLGFQDCPRVRLVPVAGIRIVW